MPALTLLFANAVCKCFTGTVKDCPLQIDGRDYTTCKLGTYLEMHKAAKESTLRSADSLADYVLRQPDNGILVVQGRWTVQRIYMHAWQVYRSCTCLP